MYGAVTAVIGVVLAKSLSNAIVVGNSQYWRIGAIYDIAGTSYYANKNLLDPAYFPTQNLSDIQNLYSPRSHIPLLVGEQIHALPNTALKKGEPLSLKDGLELNNLLMINWWKSITEYPIPYLTHRYNVFKILVTRSQWGLWGPVYRSTVDNDIGISTKPLRHSLIFELLEKSTRTPIFIPANYLLISILGACVSILYALKNNSLIAAVSLFLFLSGIAHMVGLFFFTGSSDFRYSHWMIICTMIGTTLIISELLISSLKRKSI
jgi:hypothetical protein